MAQVQPVQSLDLTDIGGSATSQFTLSFGGNTTPSLPGNSVAAAIESALNNLPSVIAAGGLVVQDTVTPGFFVITFNVADQELSITGTKTRQEAQQLNVAAVANSPTGTFTLSFGGGSTQALPGTATASTIQTSLNGLPGIAGAGGVTVTNQTVNHVNVPGGFNVVFGNIGEVPAIGVSGDVPEIQTLDLSNVQSAGNQGNVTLSFGGKTTAQPLSLNPTAAQIQSALNARFRP